VQIWNNGGSQPAIVAITNIDFLFEFQVKVDAMFRPPFSAKKRNEPHERQAIFIAAFDRPKWH
jgi:hypothetical protein